MEADKVFEGPVPQFYDRHLGPILFQPFADLIAERVGEADRAILETAAGTGIVTRAIAAWRAEPRTTWGGQPWYSALAILTALTLRAVFRPAHRQTKA